MLKVDYPTRWVMEASLLIFIFFTTSGSRRDYYILPLLPFCSLLCARFLSSVTAAKPRRVALDLFARARELYIPSRSLRAEVERNVAVLMCEVGECAAAMPHIERSFADAPADNHEMQAELADLRARSEQAKRAAQ